MNTADRIFNSDKIRLKILHSMDDVELRSFEIVAAYSVLEHIENDEEMLSYWASFLKPGGYFILSVPARMKHWGYADDVAGHLRRYEKDELLNLLERVGLDTVRCLCDGFPFQLMISKLTDVLVWKRRLGELHGKTNEEKTAVSGTVEGLYRFHRILPYRLLTAMAKFQRLFYNTDWGVDFVVLAKKKQ